MGSEMCIRDRVDVDPGARLRLQPCTRVGLTWAHGACVHGRALLSPPDDGAAFADEARQVAAGRHPRVSDEGY